MNHHYHKKKILNLLIILRHLNMLRKKKKKQMLHISLLITILLLGFVLRVIKYANYSLLEADEGRDLLVARHIVKYHEFVQLGPEISGIPGFFLGPYYYYILAIL